MLRLLSGVWSGAAALRVQAYQRGLFRVVRLPRPTVSIGALEMGGTGKSPAVAALACLLREAGLRPAILSRGYGREGSAPLLVGRGRGLHVPTRRAGDEPACYARRLSGVPVAVAARRVLAATLVERDFPPDVYLLDDAFQHVRVARDADLLVVDSAAPFWDGSPPPAGRLRESSSAAHRADAFLVLGPDPDACGAVLERRFPGRPVFRLQAEPGAVAELEPWLESGAPDPLERLPRPTFVFAGIARPERFRRTVEAAGIRVAGAREFADHHWYSPEEIGALQQAAVTVGATSLLTTEKDAVRLDFAVSRRPPLWVWQHRLRPDRKEELLAWLRQRLTSGSSE